MRAESAPDRRSSARRRRASSFFFYSDAVRHRRSFRASNSRGVKGGLDRRFAYAAYGGSLPRTHHVGVLTVASSKGRASHSLRLGSPCGRRRACHRQTWSAPAFEGGLDPRARPRRRRPTKRRSVDSGLAPSVIVGSRRSRRTQVVGVVGSRRYDRRWNERRTETVFVSDERRAGPRRKEHANLNQRAQRTRARPSTPLGTEARGGGGSAHDSRLVARSRPGSGASSSTLGPIRRAPQARDGSGGDASVRNVANPVHRGEVVVAHRTTRRLGVSCSANGQEAARWETRAEPRTGR